MEWKHAPVHDIGAISLRRIILRNVRKSADDSLAGCCLLAGRSVARFICIHDGSDLRFSGLYIFLARDRVDHAEHFLKSRFHRRDILSLFASNLKSVNCFCAADIFRIASGQSKFSQTERIGSVGGCLAGRDQFICRRDLIKDLRADLEQNILSKRSPLRPVFDVRAIEEITAQIFFSKSLIYSGPIGADIKIVFRNISKVFTELLGTRQNTAVRRSRSD